MPVVPLTSCVSKKLFTKTIFLAVALTLAYTPHAFASGSLPDQCIYALNRSAPGALTIQGSTSLNFSACGIVVDSSSPSALVTSGNGRVNAKYIDVVGGYSGTGQVTFSAAPQTGASYRADPLSIVSAPSSKKCDFTNVKISSGSSQLTPGTYCNGIAVSGTANVTLAPGTYILMGGGLHVSGSSQLKGQGTIVLTQGLGYSYGPLIISDNALLNLQALKSGDYPGILFFQDRSLGTAIAPSVINGSRNSKLEGILYFPTSNLTWSGSAAGAQGAYLAIVADTVNITGSATIASNYGSLQRWLEIASLMGIQGGSTAPQTSQPFTRISARLDTGKTFALTGNVHPLVASSIDQGDADGSVVFPRIIMHLSMTAAQQADLTQLLAAQQNKSNPFYHKWLTPEQFGARFGASQSDVSQTSAWLQSMGFTNVQAARGRTFISMTGTAAQVRYAFQTPVHKYTLNGVTHYANSADPVLPQALQGLVTGIRGLNDFHPRPHSRRSVIQPRFTSSISGNHYIAPADFWTIYNVKPLLAGGITGVGQSIAVAGQTDLAVSDIEAFQSASGLPIKDPQIVLDGPDPGTSSSDLSEADLDVEWSGAVATGATIIYVNSTDVFTSLTYAIDNNLAPVVSDSYGSCEAQTGQAGINSFNTIFQQANAQGQTVVAPAGDTGAADCDSGTGVAHLGLAVDYPGSSPNVTSAGGTAFNEGTGTYWNTTNDAMSGSAIGYIPEMVWNDSTTTAPITLSAGGGGASLYFAKPSWQQGTGVPADGARDVPDIALNASPSHDGYLICTGGSCTNGFRNASNDLQVVGGTSCATPTFAAIIALIDQQTNSRQGNVNTTLYSLASISTDAFHDVTVGNNIVTCRGGSPNCSSTVVGVDGTFGYSAGVGYDRASGLGSVNAYALATEWLSGFSLTVNPAALTIAEGASGTSTVQVTAVSGFQGTVNLSCSVASTLTNTTCSIPSSITGSGTVTLTIKNSSTAAGIQMFPRVPWYLPGAGLLAAGIGMFLFQRKRVRAMGIGLLIFAFLLIGCGGSSSSGTGTITPTPTPLTGNVTVTATSGMVTETATVAVTIPQ